MITADLHSHTLYSHGRDTPAAMYAAAGVAGLTILGFTEHAPRPDGFNYAHEYREQLSRHWGDYVREVCALRAAPPLQPGPDGTLAATKVLFGMEADWLDNQEAFTHSICTAHDFDYLLGSVHFLGQWGFDDDVDVWQHFSQEECDAKYVAYFTAWEAMIRSGLFTIAAHPDLIKIFSVERFHIWLARPESMALIRQGLMALRTAGMSLEISSAGLRKPCREIYPAPPIMALAAELNLDVSFASDAHASEDVAYGFARLANYARTFGFTESVYFERGRRIVMPF